MVFGQYKKKSNTVQIKELLISLFFLRPAVDAYRVSKNHKDDELTMSSLSELILNKCSELATESIPGGILQIYVLLITRDESETFALASITISIITTGFTSAMIAYDNDVDVSHRKAQPIFYG